MKRIVISLIDYKGKENTLACLASLERITVPKGFEIDTVIINNYPSTPFELSNTYKTFSLSIIQNPINTGFSGGHNVGIAYAKEREAKYVLILNNDTTVDPHFLVSLVEEMEKNPKAGIAVPKIYFSKGFEFHKERYTEKEVGRVFWYAGGVIDWDNIFASHRGVDMVDKGQFDKTEETPFATGCCMLLRDCLLDQIIGFDEQYFLYLEDLDLNMRAKEKGFSILYIPTSVIWHKNAGSTGGPGSQLQDYYSTRNRLLFGYTYASLRTRFALLRESVRILFAGRKWQKKGVKDFYLRKFGKGSYTP